jgi:ABC-2 type transport system permease protein
MLPIIFVIPAVQLLVLVYAANLEMKNINLTIVNYDKSRMSRELSNKFFGSPFFHISFSNTQEQASDKLKSGKAGVVLIISANFEKKIVKENYADLQLLFNAVNGSAAKISAVYCQQIISDFNQSIIANSGNIYPELEEFKKINIESSFWYNPGMDYKIYMSSGILVILVTIVSMFLSGMNLVREKEIGTIEQINVTPIRKYQFLIGKLIPFLIIALFELAFGLTIARILFHLPMLGNLGLLFLTASVYLITTLGLGLFMSTIAHTQQQVMFVSFFFMLVFVLMSGIFTPAESMPDWAHELNRLNPVAYFMRIIRMILLNGSGFKDIKTDFFALLIYGTIVLSFAVFKYRKTE